MHEYAIRDLKATITPSCHFEKDNSRILHILTNSAGEPLEQASSTAAKDGSNRTTELVPEPEWRKQIDLLQVEEKT